MGDGLLAPKITATVVNECSSAAAIVLLPVSLGEGGGGGFHLRGSAWCSQPHQTGGFLVFWDVAEESEKVLSCVGCSSPSRLLVRCRRPAFITRTFIHRQERARSRRLPRVAAIDRLTDHTRE